MILWNSDIHILLAINQKLSRHNLIIGIPFNQFQVQSPSYFMFVTWHSKLSLLQIYRLFMSWMKSKQATNPFLSRKYEHLVKVRTKEIMSYNFMTETLPEMSTWFIRAINPGIFRMKTLRYWNDSLWKKVV